MALSRAYGVRAGWPAMPGRPAPPAPPGSPDLVFAVVKLVPTYKGPAGRLVRADGAWVDLGWVGASLDYVTLNAFDDGTVSWQRWYDQNGSGAYWDGTASHLPTLGGREQLQGLPSVCFDAGYASAGYRRMDLADYTIDRRSCTIAMVASPNVNISPMRWFGWGPSNQFGLYTDFDTTTVRQSTSFQFAAKVRDQPQAMVLDCGASATKFHNDGAIASLGAISAGVNKGGVLGYNVGDTDFNGRIDYWAFLVYPTSLGDTVSAQVRDYLKQHVGGHDAGTLPNIVCWGDSITEGHKIPRNRSWPRQLSEMLAKPHAMHNCGRYGYTMDLTTSRSAGITNCFNASATKNVLVGTIGINNIVASSAVLTPTKLTAQMAKFNQAWDAIVFTTVHPLWLQNWGTGGLSNSHAVNWQAYNDELRANFASYGITHLVDVAANAEMLASAAANDTSCYIDGTHLSDHGSGIEAFLLKPVIDGIIG